MLLALKQASYIDISKSFREFKLRFRRKYGSAYPEEEEFSNPSLFAHQAYDATWAVTKAIKKSQGRTTYEELLKTNMFSTNFKGLSGEINFKMGTLSNEKTFQIINVVGESNHEIALWSLNSGFLGGKLGPLYWPGGTQTVPKGWNSTSFLGDGENVLRIVIAAKDCFQSVREGDLRSHSK